MKQLKYTLVSIAVFLWFASVVRAEPEFDCGKKLCKEMVSCEEACYKFKTCEFVQLDTDKDDVPCENVCSNSCSSNEGITIPAIGSGDFESCKQAGIQQCVSDPASCGINVTASGTIDGTSSAHATYSPITGEVRIPFIDVPGPFGGTQTYEVYLIQQPLGLAFDLDLEHIVF